MKLEGLLADKDLRAVALQKMAIRCKTDLYFLAKEVLGYSKMEPHVHQELCDYTTSILPNPPDPICPMSPDFDPRKNLLLLLMPRGTFKSSVVTIAFTLQFFLNKGNARVLIDSETFSKSKAFLREILEHLVNNEVYRAIFKAIHGMLPFTKKSEMKLWTDSEVILPCRNVPKKEPSISCAGIDVTKNGMHYDLIIADDLHSEKNVTNKEQIEQVIDHYKLAFSLLDPGCPMIIIGTRWDYSDLYQHIIDFEAEDFNILKKSAYNPDGSLLFPEVLSEEALDKIRRRQGTGHFSKQYLNEPVSDENATFKREYILHRSLEDCKARPMNYYWLIDPSYSDPRGTSTYSDFASFVLCGMDFERKLWVRHIIRAKMTYADIINKMFELNVDPKFRDIQQAKFILEVIGTKSLSYELNNEQRRRSTWLPVTEIKSRTAAKEERIRALAPFYENGNIFHVTECPQIEDLEYELLHFPTARYDDCSDALANVVEVASPPARSSYNKAQDKIKRRRVNFKPRSRLTGV